MPRRRELLAGAILAAIGVIAALALLESGVRVLHLVPDRFWQPDPLLGVRLIAGSRGWWTQEDREFVVPVQINRQGLRDVEHEYEKPAGVFRILVLGDSFVEAMHVPLEQMFSRMLEQELRRDDGGRIEVVSAGVSGYGTASEVLFFEQEGRRYHPDLVVLAFYPGNDVKNNSPSMEDYLRPVYADRGQLRKVADLGKGGGRRRLLMRSAAYRYVRQIVLQQHPQLAQTLITMGLLRPDAVRRAVEIDGVPLDYGVYATVPSAPWTEAWHYTEALLTTLQRDVAAAGARLAIVILSTREQVYADKWQQIVLQHPAMQGQAWDLDAPQHRVEAWCAMHAAACIALAPVFRAAAGSDAPRLHYAYDGHWTTDGHRLAALTVKDFLERQQLIRAQGGRNEDN